MSLQVKLKKAKKNYTTKDMIISSKTQNHCAYHLIFEFETHCRPIFDLFLSFNRFKPGHTRLNSNFEFELSDCEFST